MKCIIPTITIVIIFLFMACGETKKPFDKEKGVDFTETDNLQYLDSMIMEYINPDMEVIEIDFRAADTDDDTFSIGKGKAIVFYVDPQNNKKRKAIIIDLKDGTSKEDTTYNATENSKKYKGHKIAVMNCCSMIANNINKAMEILDADDISVDGIGTYTITLHNKPNKVKHKFSLKKRTGSVDRRVYYDEYRFEADGKGKVKKLK